MHHPLSAQSGVQTLPAGVTSEMISAGKTVFKGQGACFGCHGEDAKGIPNLGANLTDSVWVHGDGSFQSIVKTITDGTHSASGVVMPPKGGASLSDDAVRKVATYVWSLSHPRQRVDFELGAPEADKVGQGDPPGGSANRIPATGTDDPIPHRVSLAKPPKEEVSTNTV